MAPKAEGSVSFSDPSRSDEASSPPSSWNLELTNIVQILPPRFPNLKLAYFSSRTYGGWAIRPGGGEPGNSEPFSYESGFAVKWLIQQQLQGDPALNFDPLKGAVKAPWLSWAAKPWFVRGGRSGISH